MITLTNEGTHMKLESSGLTNEPQFIPLNAIYVRVYGDNVIMRWVSSIKGANNEAVINYNDVTSPTVTSAEDLADQIMEWATSLASGDMIPLPEEYLFPTTQSRSFIIPISCIY